MFHYYYAGKRSVTNDLAYVRQSVRLSSRRKLNVTHQGQHENTCHIRILNLFKYVPDLLRPIRTGPELRIVAIRPYKRRHGCKDGTTNFVGAEELVGHGV